MTTSRWSDAGLVRSLETVAAVMAVGLMFSAFQLAGVVPAISCGIEGAVASIGGAGSSACESPAQIPAAEQQASIPPQQVHGRALGQQSFLAASSPDCSTTQSSAGKLCLSGPDVVGCPATADGPADPACFASRTVDVSALRCSPDPSRPPAELCLLPGVGGDAEGTLVTCVAAGDDSAILDRTKAACTAAPDAALSPADQQWCDAVDSSTADDGATLVVSVCSDANGQLYRCTRQPRQHPVCDSRSFGEDELACITADVPGQVWCGTERHVFRCAVLTPATGQPSNLTSRPVHCQSPTAETATEQACPSVPVSDPTAQATSQKLVPGLRRPLGIDGPDQVQQTFNVAMVAFCANLLQQALTVTDGGPPVQPQFAGAIVGSGTVVAQAITGHEIGQTADPTDEVLAHVLGVAQEQWVVLAAAMNGVLAEGPYDADVITPTVFPPPFIAIAGADGVITLPGGEPMVVGNPDGATFIPGEAGAPGLIVVGAAVAGSLDQGSSDGTTLLGQVMYDALLQAWHHNPTNLQITQAAQAAGGATSSVAADTATIASSPWRAGGVESWLRQHNKDGWAEPDLSSFEGLPTASAAPTSLTAAERRAQVRRETRDSLRRALARLFRPGQTQNTATPIPNPFDNPVYEPGEESEDGDGD